MHDDSPNQSQRVDGDVSLAAGDLFAGVVASFFAPFGRPDRLTVDDRHARRELFAHRLTQPPQECFVDLRPHTGFTPSPEKRVYRLPFGKVARQGAPLTAGAVEIEDGVDDPSSVDMKPADLSNPQQQSANQLPLFVRQTAGIIRYHRYGSVFLDLRTKKAES